MSNQLAQVRCEKIRYKLLTNEKNYTQRPSIRHQFKKNYKKLLVMKTMKYKGHTSSQTIGKSKSLCIS